jgi:hypothetical protein
LGAETISTNVAIFGRLGQGGTAIRAVLGQEAAALLAKPGDVPVGGLAGWADHTESRYVLPGKQPAEIAFTELYRKQPIATVKCSKKALWIMRTISAVHYLS